MHGTTIKKIPDTWHLTYEPSSRLDKETVALK